MPNRCVDVSVGLPPIFGVVDIIAMARKLLTANMHVRDRIQETLRGDRPNIALVP